MYSCILINTDIIKTFSAKSNRKITENNGMKKTGLTRAEAAAIVLTLVFAAFTLGFHLASGSSADGAELRISTENVRGKQAEPSPAAPAADADGETPAIVNINTASADELQSLHGVGEAIAQRIIDYREANGPFERIEDITRVSGIGSATFEDIMDFITVG